jgi:hypothetical protein
MGRQNKESFLELAASGLDTLLGVAGTVAPLSSINSLRKLIEQKRTDRTVKNFKAFLKETNEATSNQREKFKKKMGNGYQHFQENLLKALDELDREEKAKILGKLQLALFEEKIQPDEFMKFAKILSLIYVSTLKFFLSKDSSSFSFTINSSINEQYYNELMGLGLVSTEFETKTDPFHKRYKREEKPMVVQKYKFSSLGTLLNNICNYNSRQVDYKERIARQRKRRV